MLLVCPRCSSWQTLTTRYSHFASMKVRVLHCHIRKSCLGLAGGDCGQVIMNKCTELVHSLEEHYATVAQEKAELTSTQKIRVEQDLAYQRSLEMDARKSKEREDAERASKLKFDQEESERMRIDKQKLENESIISEIMKRMAIDDNQNVAADGELYQISLQLIDGERITKSFKKTTSTRMLYDWAFTRLGSTGTIGMDDFVIRRSTMMMIMSSDEDCFIDRSDKATLESVGIENRMKLIVELKKVKK